MALPWIIAAAIAATPASLIRVDFATEIQPLLKAKCGSCHGPDSPAGGLRLDTAAGLRKGGTSGLAFISGKSADSLIVQRILGQGDGPRMPMGFAPLSDSEIAKIRLWIDQGASFAAGAGGKRHWSYDPPKRSPLPMVKQKAWIRNPIDAFVLARLEKENLKPSAEAPREILARRASLDLTGLPPTVEELDRFLADKRPDAYDRYVDRLLASPHYGEKMARTWLDLARYADTNGYEKDLPRQMWLWRDWVINAFNRNEPFDQFTIDQLAGDLLPNATRDQLIATGFHRNSMLNDEGGIDPEEFRVVAVIDRVDATATTWMGTTMACAQCHDHKYDPLPQKDYYRFFAFFNQSADNGRDATPMMPVPTAAQQAELDEIGKRLAVVNNELAILKPRFLKELAHLGMRQTWEVPVPEAKAAGANLKVLPDNSILASGPDPKADRYTVSFPLQGDLHGIRLEAIPDPSLPEGSSGRNFNGNFVVRRVFAKVIDANGIERKLNLKSARADFSQGDFDPNSTIRDGDGLGWAIAGFEPANRTRHALVIELDGMYMAKPGDRLVVEIQHQTRYPNHNLGRFRISVTSDETLAATIPPTAAQQAILDKPEAQRTTKETEALQAYYLASSPELAEQQAKSAELRKRQDELNAMIPTVMVMRNTAKPRPNRILKRGDFRTPGDPVVPGTPEVLGGTCDRQDRLGLARWLVDPKNPLTSRVEINRLWEQCFGRGLVGTPEDFGSQGDAPSHPELLDFLASEMITRKWDMKAMLKLIVTSATYRQSSRVRPEIAKEDPYNILLSHGPRFRMEAEGVRDIALRASGRLSETIGGPSVMPPQPPGIWENSFSFYDTRERWVNATGPNRYRRGLYTYWRRTAPFPMAMTFDLKSRDSCTAHRSRTNTPLQALNTLNDPLFLECAGALGTRMSLAKTQEKAIAYGFQACTSRLPNEQEIGLIKKVYQAALAKYKADPAKATQFLKAAGVDKKEMRTVENAAWVVVANVLLNLDETITCS